MAWLHVWGTRCVDRGLRRGRFRPVRCSGWLGLQAYAAMAGTSPALPTEEGAGALFSGLGKKIPSRFIIRAAGRYRL